MAQKLQTHYETLKVAPDAPQEVIKAAYKALSQKHHPDKNPGNPEAVRIMAVINGAYEVLSDPKKRADYDFMLRQQQARTANDEPKKEPPKQDPPKYSQKAQGTQNTNSTTHEKKKNGGLPLAFILIPGIIAALNSGGTHTTTPAISYSAPTPAPYNVAAPASKTDYTVPAINKPEQPLPEDDSVGDIVTREEKYDQGLPAIQPPPIQHLITAQALATCIFTAAQTYTVPPSVILGILNVEGGRTGQAVRNENNTYNLGPMQINTIWIPELSRYWRVSESTALKMVRDNPCVNVGVGAWILRTKMNETGSLYSGIGSYHSAAQNLAQQYNDPQYREKVLAAMRAYRQVKSPSDLVSVSEIPQLYISTTDLVARAEKGFEVDQEALAERYMQGDTSTPRDFAKSFLWAQKAADHGNQNAEYILAALYKDGKGAPKNMDESNKWLELADKNGDVECFADCDYSNSEKQNFDYKKCTAACANPQVQIKISLGLSPEVKAH